jgi:hypothetical protein
MATQVTPERLNLDEQVIRIEQMMIENRRKIAERDKMVEEREKIIRESIKLERETKLMPVSLIFQAMLAAAALLGAGATITKLFFSH